MVPAATPRHERPEIQAPAPFGPYILDLYCADARLVVEVDGGHHFEDENRQRDAIRTRYLESGGLRVLRFTNIEALTQTDAVLEVILAALENPSP